MQGVELDEHHDNNFRNNHIRDHGIYPINTKEMKCFHEQCVYSFRWFTNKGTMYGIQQSNIHILNQYKRHFGSGQVVDNGNGLMYVVPSHKLHINMANLDAQKGND